MPIWFKRLRGALALGLSWSAAWALAGLSIGVASLLTPSLPWDRFFAVFDAPLPALAIPGFVGGVIFSGVLRVAGRGRRFDDLSLPHFAAWGALGGLLLSLVPDVMVVLGLATLAPSASPLGTLTAIIAAPFTLLGALSASATLLIARRAERRWTPTLSAEADPTRVRQSGHEPSMLPSPPRSPISRHVP
jgi:hypothetical protein